MSKKRILIIEDEHALASALAAVCRRIDCETTLCYSGERGLEELSRGSFSLVVLDIGLPDMSGLAVLEKVRAKTPGLPMLVITAHGSLDNAVAAKKLGASAYLVKPLDLKQVSETLCQLLDAPASQHSDAASDSLPLFVGAAAAMQKCFIEIANACASDAPVLINGPTGTGKTLAARVIHSNSTRRDTPFVTLHCGALPETLLESELFGHEKNSFTGAVAMKSGHIERAAGGTLFLDEIADITPAIQAKLLRFVEEKTFVRVGGREDIHVDLRIIVATNRDLRAEVRAGRFREDLFYRLHVLEIEMPPLSQRREDIPALAAVILAAVAPGRSLELAPDTLELIRGYDWPGNVRELRNALEHAAAVSSGTVIFPQQLPRDIRERLSAAPRANTEIEAALAAWLEEKLRTGAGYDHLHDEIESMLLKHLLHRFDNKPTVMARVMNMNRVTLRKKCRQFFDEEGVRNGGELSDKVH